MMAIIGTRLAAAVAVLIGLIVVQWAAPAALLVVVQAALVVFPILGWTVFGFFVARAMEDARHPKEDGPILSLKARVQDALALALAQTALAGIVLLRIVTPPGEPIFRDGFLVGLSFALLMIAAPAVNWLLLWRPWRSA